MNGDAPAILAGAVCNHCNSVDRWILHNVRHHRAYRRLCTTCVLNLNSSSFCPICFSLYDRPKKRPEAAAAAATPVRSTLTCFKCGSFSHANCVPPNAPRSPYLCPTCSNPNSKLFDSRKSLHNKGWSGGVDGTKPNHRHQIIDLKSSKVFLAAAMIAANSMNDAAEMARTEAEKRAKESVMARKRAKEALESIASMWARRERERLRRREAVGEAEISISAVAGSNQRKESLSIQVSDVMNGLGFKSTWNPVGKNGGTGVVPVGAKRNEEESLILARAQLGGPSAAVVVHNNDEDASDGGQAEKKDAGVNKNVGNNGLHSGSQILPNKNNHHGGNGNLGLR